jgi:LuxR family maltose regulon positive regulatory protein
MLLTTFEQTTEWPQMARCRTLYSAGILYWYNCQLALAERTFYHGLHLARQHNLHVAVTLCHFGLAVTASRYNQGELAEDYHLKVVKEPHFQNGLRAVLSAYSLIGMYSSRGQLDLARNVVQRLKSHATMMGRPYLLSQVAALEAYLALRSGELAVALRWALTGSRGPMYSSSDRIPLIHAQVLMAEGSSNSLYEATQILHDLSYHHETQRAWIFWLETIVPLALAWVKLGSMEAALLALGRAVRLAAPNGLVDPFVEQGKPMEDLLRELEKQAEYTQLVQLLLAAFPADKVAPPTTVPTPISIPVSVSIEALPEPLTEREIDVLVLLAGRLSNKEIAQKLIVSVHTVRNHTANIFGKLQVDNRLQAVARARSIGLLPQESQQSLTDRSLVP